jgi:hypothetical protein
MILGDGTEVRMGNTYGQGEVGDERGSKEMDRCPLTVFLIQRHMTDIMMKITLSADVTGLPTAVAGLREGFKGPSAVDVHRDARRECARRGVHCCRGRSGGRM